MKKKLLAVSLALAFTSTSGILHAEGNINAGKEKAAACVSCHGENGNSMVSTFPKLAQQHPIRLVVYNLGYLPKGNKKLTTLTDSTLQSLENALALIQPGGVVSITCYPGHEEGAKEEAALLQKVAQLSPSSWNVETPRSNSTASTASIPSSPKICLSSLKFALFNVTLS